MQKTCVRCQAEFEIATEDLAFYEDFSTPPPTRCFDCRSQNRCVHRNEMNLYKRNCDLCERSIVAMYPSEVTFPVYCQECFFGDNWNPLDYGQKYDFSRPFFDQFGELLSKIPHLAIINKLCQNSEYCNYSYANKNCYLTQGSHYEEDCYYDVYSAYNKNCVDNLSIFKSELLYECYFCKNCYHCLYLNHSDNCRDCHFSRDLKGCENCLFCANLHQKKYHIFNKPYSEEEYKTILASHNLHTSTGIAEARRIFVEDMAKEFPVRAVHQVQCENCEGSPMSNCKNIRHAFFCTDSEDSAYGFELNAVFSSQDIDNMGYDKSEHCYLLIGCLGLFDCIGCNACWNGSNVGYSHFCFSCHNCFGCASLHQLKDCIFNTQYSKEEYEEIVPKIIEHMKNDRSFGEFFPESLSPFGYNETKAQEIYPLSKQAAVQKGYTWAEDKPLVGVERVIDAKELPEEMKDITDDISRWAIRCETTNREYRITKEELAFYKNMNLPAPRLHQMERFRRRCEFRNPHKLWGRSCAKCKIEFQTTYSPERPEIVYCEKCYLAEVY